MPEPAQQPHILEVRGLFQTARQSRTNAWTVLHDINLTIKSGEFVILYGPSGAGKSTLLSLMAGLAKPTQGDIIFRGESILRRHSDDLSSYRLQDIGIIFSQDSLLPHLTILENVALPDVLKGTGRRARMNHAMDFLRQVELESYAQFYPAQAPASVLQKAVIIRALTKSPGLLLVNEPTQDLDTQSGKEIMELFTDLNRGSGTSIFMVSQNPEHVYYPHRVLYMKDGSITHEVINRPLTPPQVAPEVALAAPDGVSQPASVPSPVVAAAS